jgi:hypothetical protein
LTDSLSIKLPSCRVSEKGVRKAEGSDRLLFFGVLERG